MENNKFEIGNILIIRAKPNSSKSEIVFNKETDKFDVFIHSIPDDNKANKELVKLFKKQLKLKVEIISGFKSRDKKVKIIN